MLTYQFPVFAIETRKTKPISEIKLIGGKSFLLKWNKNQKCERPKWN